MSFPLSGRLKRAKSHQSLTLTQMTVSCAQLWHLPFRLVTQSFLAFFKEDYVRSNGFVFFFFIKCTCRQKSSSDLILFSVKRSQEEGSVQEIKEQLEALTAHMDYVQENITDCQTSIMEMEVQTFTL